MKRSTNYLLSTLMAFLLIAVGIEAFAQDLLNTASGTIENTATGKIRFNTNNGRFMNQQANIANIVNNGTIEFTGATNLFTDGSGNVAGATALGVTSAMRVPGLVLYSGAAGNQNIQARWYQNLELSNAAQKLYADAATYVSGTYTAAGGDRDYNAGTSSEFVYDGSAAQTIFAESGAPGGLNRYFILSFENAGVKTLNTGETNNVDDASNMRASNTGGVVINGIYNAGTTFNEDAASTLTVDGATAALHLGSDLATFAGPVTVSSGGLVDTEGGGDALIGGAFNVTQGTLNLNNGDATVANGGSLALANNVAAVIDVDADRTLTVTGNFSNAVAIGSRSNMVFDDASTIIYNGANQIVANDQGFPYGSVEVTTAAHTVEGSFYLSQNLTVTDFDLNMTPAFVLTMLDEGGNVTYGSGIEVIRKFRRMFNGTGNTLTFNNNETTIQLTDNPASLTDLTLDVQPLTQHSGDWNPVTDVERVINFDYNQTAPNWTTSFRYGFKASDHVNVNPDSLTEIRFREVIGAGASEQISTGVINQLTRDVTASPFRWAQLNGIKPTGSPAPPTILAEVADNAEVFLRGGPAEFISITSGRWSNPGTWDAGEEPPPNAIVTIRDGTQVHTGFTRFNADNFTTPEQWPGTLAQSVTIEADAGAGGAALLFGQTGPGGESPTNNFAFSSGAVIYNNATSPLGVLGLTTADLANFAGPGGPAPAVFAGRGYIVYEGSTVKSHSFENTGSIHNAGTIEVGD